VAGLSALTDIADELYGLTPAEFTATRNARAAEHKMLAAQIRAFRKPSASAWVCNMLVRFRAEEIREALELGGELRQAQGERDRAGLALLTRQRRQLVGAVAAHAGELADELGHPISASVIDEVAQTLQAAMSDGDAARALLTGRLVRALSAVGFEPVDLEGAVAAAEPRAAAAKREGADAEALEAARAAVREAERLEKSAAAEVDQVDRRMVRLGGRRDRLAEERGDLEEQLRAVKADIAAAEREARALDREHDRAASASEEAAAAADAARAALAAIED
jgi:hypothetical protein